MNPTVITTIPGNHYKIESFIMTLHEHPNIELKYKKTFRTRSPLDRYARAYPEIEWRVLLNSDGKYEGYAIYRGDDVSE